MNIIPCRERTFTLELVYDYEYHFGLYLRWLRHLLERLGRERTVALWEETFQDYDKELLTEILSAGWQETAGSETDEVESQVSTFLSQLFPSPFEDLSGKQARKMVEGSPPFRQIRRRFPTLDWKRETKTYEALALFGDGLALLVEGLIDRFGKQGELIAYDAVVGEWTGAQLSRMSAEEYLESRLARFSSQPDRPTMHSAGLEVELVRGSDKEVVTRVTQCEWARYYLDHHPRVGYLLACSHDNAAYSSISDRVRLQRTTTLMEGGKECDFRVYALEETL